MVGYQRRMRTQKQRYFGTHIPFPEEGEGVGKEGVNGFEIVRMEMNGGERKAGAKQTWRDIKVHYYLVNTAGNSITVKPLLGLANR